MLSDRPLFALILASTLALAGCATPGGSPDAAQSMTLAPGSNASTPIVFADANAQPDDVSLSVSDDAGLDVELPDPLHANDTGALAGWVTVSAPEDADEGEHAVVVSLETPDGESLERVLSVTVETPSDPLEQGEIGMLELTARTQDGGLAFTNNETVANAPLPEAPGYQAPQRFDPIPAPLSPRGQLPAELVQAVIGSDVNHSLSVEVPEAFGPASIENPQPREETVEREVQIPSEIEVPARQAQQVLPRDAQEGDEVDLPVTGNPNAPAPYIVDKLGQQQVRFTFAHEAGERLTLYPAWPDGANVTEVGEENTTLYVTPTQSKGERLTWVEPWGNTTEITEITDATVTLRHSPEEGLSYTKQSRRSQQPVEATVVNVTQDQIIVSQENPHPLAGQTLVFETTILDRKQAPQGSPQPGQPPQPSP